MPKMTRMIPAAMYRDPVVAALNAFAGFDDFGESTGYYGREGDEWDIWCNKAAAIWPGADKRALLVKCVDGNVTVPARFVAPWTVLGKAARGLPVNFSNDPREVAAGISGKLVETAGEVVDTAKKVIPDTATTQPATGTVVTMQPVGTFWNPIGVIKGEGGVVKNGGKRSGKGEDGRVDQPPAADQPPVGGQPSTSDNTMLIVGGAVGLALLLLLKSRKAGAVAGFGSYRRRRRARR